MFLRLNNGSFVTHDIIGTITTNQGSTGENGRDEFIVFDKRGKVLGFISHRDRERFLRVENSVIIPAAPGWFVALGPREKRLGTAIAPIIAWRITPDIGLVLQQPPEPILPRGPAFLVFGDEFFIVGPEGDEYKHRSLPVDNTSKDSGWQLPG